MSALNFLNKTFSKITLDDKNEKNKNEKNKKNDKNKNEKKNDIDVDGGIKEKSIKFNHGVMIKLKKGVYKGYNGYVLESYPDTFDVKFEYTNYILVKHYGLLNIGSIINTNYGKSTIVQKIDKLYVIKTSNETNLNMFSSQLVKVLYKDNALFIVEMNGKKVNLGLKLNSDNKETMLSELSKVVQNGELDETIYELSELSELSDSDIYYMIICNSDDKSDIEHIGKYGKCISIIDEQYMIKYTRISRFDKKNLDINGKNVIVKRGEFKGKIGEIANINKASLNVHIDALNKSISRHVVFDKFYIKERSVEVGDVFYNDVMLKSGLVINVTKITENIMYGYDKHNNEVTFKKDDIEKYLPGFKIISKKEIDNDIYTEEDNLVSEEQQEEEHQYEEDDSNEVEIMGYEVNEVNEVNDTNDTNEKTNDTNEKTNGFENGNVDEMELKVSFKDMERCEFVAQKLSKEETEIMNSIDKVIRLLNYPCDIINKYTLLSKIVETEKVMKAELEKINIKKWKKSDMKYVIMYLVIAEVIKNRELHMTYNTFKSQIEKLYNIGYFTKSDVMGSCFLITEKENENIIKTCFGLTMLSEEESLKMREIYKKSKYLEIMIKMVENCGVILQEWYGKINLKGCKNVEVKIYNVAEGRREKEYPKYFLTTNDILTGNIPETSKKIVWGPQSEYLVNIWKTGLNKKMMSCDDNEKKSIYEYVINNFDNAPFMRSYVPTNEIERVKYTELMKTFVKFVGQLKEYVNMKRGEKMCKLSEMNKEKERVNKKRRELSDLRGLEYEFDNIDIRCNKKIKK